MRRSRRAVSHAVPIAGGLLRLILPAGRGGQGHFDYGKAWGKYAGTEWEPLLNIDSVPPPLPLRDPRP